jgi:hypothetical protein
MYYFGYCTWLDRVELDKHFTDPRFVAHASAPNHKVEFRAVGEHPDRGWCHLSDRLDACGTSALGAVFEVRPEGDDGTPYDCFTYVATRPGPAMRPPKMYWNHVKQALELCKFPLEYVESVRDTYETSRPCVDDDVPFGAPSRAAEVTSGRIR